MRSSCTHVAARRARAGIEGGTGAARGILSAGLIHSCLAAALGGAALVPVAVSGQSGTGARPAAPTVPAAASLDSLLARALVVNPRIRAARAHVTGARARVSPAGVRPDPMLMAGVQNLPVHGAGFGDVMTMKMVGVSQTFPYHGKLGLQQRAAEWEAGGASLTLVDVTRQVAYDVREAYYELAFVDRAIEIVRHNQDMLGDLLRLTDAKYRAGTAAQSDVLKGRVDAARLAETAVGLVARRRAALARLNAALDRPSDTPVARAEIPVPVVRAAVPDSARRVEFASPALGAPAAGSPLPPLDSLQALALRASAALGAHAATMEAQAARAALARKAALPDVAVALQYGQRQAEADMVTAVVSLPFPLRKRRNQDELAAGANADLLALEAEHAAMENELRAEVARLYTEAERARTQLALYVGAILPQGRAVFASAMVGYQAGRAELAGVTDAQVTLFTTETDDFRALTDFATAVAALERIVGQEILR